MKVVVATLSLLLSLPAFASAAGKVRGVRKEAQEDDPALSISIPHHRRRRRKAVKVGANKDPKVTPRNPSDPCVDAVIDGKKVFNGGELNKICLNGIADLCTFFYGYTEYECECLPDNPACADPSILTEENACLDGYVLQRNNLQGALFWTCDQV